MNNPGINVNWVPGITLDEMEKNCILAAFRFYRGNKTHTASALGISIRTLEHKMERYEADKLRERERDEQDRKHAESELDRMRGPQLTKQFAIGSSDQWATPDAASSTIGQRTKDDSKKNEANGKGGNSPTNGVRMEPTAQTKPEHAVPVSQRKETEALLSRQASGNSKRPGR